MQSEVKRLMEQIDQEYQAALNGMHAFKCGSARHDFINARMGRIDAFHEELSRVVGPEEAIRLIFAHVEQL